MRWYILDKFGSLWGPVVGFCEHGNEPPASVKYKGISGVAERTVAFQGGLHFMHL
jgi:hypothetical protein